MKMKKVAIKFGFITLCTAAIITLSGCGSTKDTTAKMKLGEDVIKEETTLDVYASSGKSQNYLTDMAKIYNEKNDANIKLKFTTVASGTATVQMITPKLVSQEEMPDIVSITDSSAAGVLEKFEDSFYSATDYGFYDKYGKEFYAQKLNILKAQSSKDQVIPYANDITSAVSYYQPKFFEQVGTTFEDIKSWDEYIEVAKKIKGATGVYGIALPEAGDQELFINIMAQQNAPLLDDKGNINLETKEAKNAAAIIKKMIDADIVNFYGANDGEKAFQESAMFVAGGWYATNMSLNFPNASGNWRMAPIVPFSKEDAGKSPVSGGSSWYVPKKGKNPEVAQQFLSFILSNEDCLKAGLENGMVLSNTKAYETEAASKEFEYFGGQKYFEVLNSTNDNMADVSFPPSYSDATAYVSTASYKYWQTGDFDASYVKEATNFAQKYGVEVNK
ncbi:lactose/L-arabinose transport system substrate-binding protein [Enterococcus sp. AZ194]|uniref:ABC transporter substrate-binding protein n=1 Tax=Enterococcus sp. AZ194 TaxID=2774629 RepID=UPI003F23E4DD